MLTVELSEPVVRRLLDALWYGQWTTCNAAENQTCSYGCVEENTFEDQNEHLSTCSFLKLWTDLAALRTATSDSRAPKVRG